MLNGSQSSVVFGLHLHDVKEVLASQVHLEQITVEFRFPLNS